MKRERKTMYDLLNVGPDATEQEIRSAFRKLAQNNHPDRFHGDQRKRAEKSFQEITEAFNVLSRPDRRKEYDRELEKGGDSQTVLDPAEISRRLAAKGAQAFRSGQFPQAKQLLEQALDNLETNSRAHYFLALTQVQIKGQEREALRHLERAAQLEPDNPTILAEAGRLCLAAGMKVRAQRFADRALTFDPTSARAQEVLNILASPEKPQGEGLLSRLRRKG